mgnify:CR=1 FL=1
MNEFLSINPDYRHILEGNSDLLKLFDIRLGDIETKEAELN